MSQPPSPRGRLFQHETFVFDELDGDVVERLLADVDDGGVPIALLLKPRGKFWQWFFLDAGINFWSEYADDVVEDLLTGSTCIDYGQRFGVVGSRIGIIRGEAAPRIRVALSAGELVLETIDASTLDAPMQVRFERADGDACQEIESR